MNRTSSILHSVILTALIGMAISCGDSGGDMTVATVGDYDITLAEFTDFTAQINTPFGSAQEEFDFKRQALDTVITKRLLVQAAYEKGIDSLEQVARLVLASKDRFLLDVLYERIIVEGITVEDAEIAYYYDMLEYQMRFSHILVDNKDTADALIQRLMDGENFEQLAYDYSQDPSAKRNRGDIGYNLWGGFGR